MLWYITLVTDVIQRVLVILKLCFLSYFLSKFKKRLNVFLACFKEKIIIKKNICWILKCISFLYNLNL